MAGDKLSIKVVENALAMLEVFSETRGDWGVTQLSQRLGMHKSQVFRLLATFERRGYIERGEAAGRYRTGLAAFETGRKFVGQLELLRLARPLMRELAQYCRETVYLGLAAGEELVLLEMCEPAQPVKVSPLIGSRCGCRADWTGRQGRGRGPGSQRSIGLDRELILDPDGLGEGVCCLAVPVLNAEGRLLGGLCLVAPEFRMTSDRLDKEFGPQLRRAGRRLSAQLGFAGGPGGAG